MDAQPVDEHPFMHGAGVPKYAFPNRLLAVSIGEIGPDGPIHTIEEIL
jgi:hypothetical protein